MGRKAGNTAEARGRGWRGPLIGALVILGIAAATVTWWVSGPATGSSGSPRLPLVGSLETSRQVSATRFADAQPGGRRDDRQ